MKRPAQLCSVLTVALLSGCASTSSTDRAPSKEKCYRHGAIRTCSAYHAPSREQVADVQKLRPASNGIGRLIVVRNDWLDAHGQVDLTLNGAALTALIPCSVLGVDVSPGAHTLQVGNLPDTQSRLNLNLASQEVAVVRVRRTPSGASLRGFSLSRMEKADALKLVQECPVLGLLDRTAEAST